MSVFRVEKTKDYTIMSNHHLKNEKLSLKAKGLLSQMLSLPENWDYTLAGLSRINKESVGAIRTAVWELEEAGYITRRQGRDSKGKMTAIEYIIYEQPQPKTQSPMSDNPTPDNPMSKNPTSDKSTSENPTSENHTQLNIYKSNTKFIKNLSINQSINQNARNALPCQAGLMDRYNQNTEIVKSNIGYEALIHSHDKAVIHLRRSSPYGLLFRSIYDIIAFNKLRNAEISRCRMYGEKEKSKNSSEYRW